MIIQRLKNESQKAEVDRRAVPELHTRRCYAENLTHITGYDLTSAHCHGCQEMLAFDRA